MDYFFQRIKEIRDKFGAVATCVDEEELIHLALEALLPEYDAFYSAIRTRNDILTLEELNTLLNVEERSIKKRSINSDLRDSTSLAMAVNQFSQGFTRGRGKNGNNRGRGNGRGGNQFFDGGQFHNSNNQVLDHQFLPFPQTKSFSSQGQKVACQICGKNDHSALDCYHRMNFAYQGRHAPVKLASMVARSMAATSGANQNQNWLIDIGASDHITPDLSQLSLA